MGRERRERRRAIRSAYDRLASAYLEERTAEGPPESDLVADLLSELDPGAGYLMPGATKVPPY